MQGVQVLLVSLSCLLAITMVQAFRIMPTATFFKSVTTRSSTSNTVMNALKSPDDVSSFTEIVAPSDNNLGKYRLVGTLPGPVLAEYMEQYKAEFKKRKSSFSGFRPGYIPPYAMVDVRRYVICFGLESLITEACETNGLMLRNEDGGIVDLSSDKYYSSIIVADSKGNDYEAQRALWKEGKDFQFTAEFCAVLNPDGPSDPNAIGGEGDEEDDGEDDVSEEMMNKIIDTIATSD